MRAVALELSIEPEILARFFRKSCELLYLPDADQRIQVFIAISTGW